jgi:tetratricopeptide (TPR) repeat protein
MSPLGPAVLFAVLLAVPVAASQSAPQGPSDGAAYYFILGLHLEGEGKTEEAIAAHERAIGLAPESAELRAELAGVYARNNRAREALDTAQAALERDPANHEANRIVGTIYAALSEEGEPARPGENVAEYPARAIAALEKARRDRTADLNIDLLLGRLYAQTRAFDKALPLLRRVVDQQPGYQDGVLLLATAQESAGAVDDAIETLETALQGNPKFYRGQLRLAETYERAERWPQAAEAFERALALNTRNTALIPRRAVALINAGQAREAGRILSPLVTGSTTPGAISRPRRPPRAS